MSFFSTSTTLEPEPPTDSRVTRRDAACVEACDADVTDAPTFGSQSLVETRLSSGSAVEYWEGED
jgi:hypothetical protein